MEFALGPHQEKAVLNLDFQNILQFRADLPTYQSTRVQDKDSQLSDIAWYGKHICSHSLTIFKAGIYAAISEDFYVLRKKEEKKIKKKADRIVTG